MGIAILSYGLTVVAFAMLAVLVAVSWRRNALSFRVLVACIAMTAWAVVIMVSHVVPALSLDVIFVTELLRNAALLWAVLGIGKNVLPRWLPMACAIAVTLVMLLGLARRQVAFIGFLQMDDVQWLARAALLCAGIGLVALEQIYRNAPANSRWALRSLLLGFGALFAYDLFLYSQVELLRGIPEDAWIARGAVIALAVPMIAIGIRRHPDGAPTIFVSRQVVFYTGAFLAMGLYLIVVAVGGYYVRIVGGSWGRFAQILLLSGAIVVLAVVLFSSTMRRRAQVFIAKHFYRNKYDYRVEWLRFVETLSSGHGEHIHRTALQAIAQTLAGPGGILYVVNDKRDRFDAVATWPEHNVAPATSVAAEDDMVKFLAQRQWIIDTREHRHTPDVYQNVNLPSWLVERADLRIVSPILELERLAGFVVLYEGSPPFDLTYEDRDLLKTLGRHVATHLAQHEASRQLAESRQFDAFNRLTAFMMHDLKNSAAQLNLIGVNARKHRNNPEFIDDTLATIANAAERIARLIEQLSGAGPVSLLRRVDMADLVQQAARRCADRAPKPTLRLIGGANVRADKDRLQAVLEHVIRNAQDATALEGQVSVAMEAANSWVRVTVSDNGAGMDAQFVRDRLFKPFDSTKGSKGMGIGAYQVREYVRMLGGDVEVRSSPGQGTAFTLSLPTLAEGIT